MSKVIAKDFRTTKEIKLPLSGITVVVYSTLLVSQIEELGQEKKGSNIEIMLKTLKSWDLYGSEEDTEPLPINMDNFGRIPAPDIMFMAEEIEKFATLQKKSSES